MTPALLLLALTAADPCAPPPPAAAPDPSAARAYRDVGDAERRAGHLDTAAVAYRDALALDPTDAAAREALAAVCGDRTSAAAFHRGVRELDAGDVAAAAGSFAEARGAGAAAALLEGVCRYELRDDERARALLAEARDDPSHREAAELYLGLLALREGDGGAAARSFEVAQADPQLAALAAPLARAAQRTGRFVVAALAGSGWDSNAQLAPSGTPIDTSNDGQLDLAASARYRFTGESGPFVAARGLFHQQLRFTELDAWALAAAAGWQLGRGDRAVSAEYGYEYRTLGGSPFLSAHGLRAAAWMPAGPLALSFSYALRLESYQGSLYQPFSGTFQGGEAEVSVLVTPRSRLGFGYRLARDGVDLPELSFVEHGPRLVLRFVPGSRARVYLDAGLSWRGYDALDAQLAVTRSDTYLDGTAALEWDLTGRTYLRVSVDARQAWSNAAGFTYLRVAPALALGWVAGL